MPLSWVEYKGHQILYNDFRGLSEDQMIAQLDEELKLLEAARQKTRMLVDVTGAPTGSRFMTAAKAMAKRADELTEKQAILGVDGVKLILLRAFNAIGGGSLKPFETETLAKEYLAR